MATVKDAVQEIVDELKNVRDIREIFDTPVEITDFNVFAVAWPSSGEFQKISSGFITGLHNINIDFFVHREDLASAFDELIDIYDRIPNQLETGLEAGRFTAVETWDSVTYDVNPAKFGGVDFMVVSFVVNDVKVLDTI